jgi:isoaspartyl peptidase/L-asparaginase-like protein (Ntn-hydrolase superfamily)
MRYAILTHGGAASPEAFSDGCVAAAEAARAVLDRGGDALAAALAATVVLEDDPRFNAGTGSNLRLDGATIEMDASVMASDGRFGGVACIERVKNPILVAARVMETPHLLLAGPGATAFARHIGFEDFDPTTDRARDKHAAAIADLEGRGEGRYARAAIAWQKGAVDRFWNFGARREATDTVGAVVRDAQGRFAATASTGGTVFMLRGRVGDSPLFGAGVYAGPHGAVATTGVGEEIVRRFLAKTVYDWVAEGLAPARAAGRALAMFPEVVDVGLCVVGRSGQVVTSNRSMAHASLAG